MIYFQKHIGGRNDWLKYSSILLLWKPNRLWVFVNKSNWRVLKKIQCFVFRNEPFTWQSNQLNATLMMSIRPARLELEVQTHWFWQICLHVSHLDDSSRTQDWPWKKRVLYVGTIYSNFHDWRKCSLNYILFWNMRLELGYSHISLVLILVRRSCENTFWIIRRRMILFWSTLSLLLNWKVFVFCIVICVTTCGLTNGSVVVW